MFLTIKNTMGGWLDKFWDIDFKSTKTYDFWNVMVKTVHLLAAEGRKQIFEKIMFCFKEGYVFRISSRVRGMS